MSLNDPYNSNSIVRKSKNSFETQSLASYVPSVILILLWGIPDLLGPEPLFPFLNMDTLNTPTIIGMIAVPLCGAVVILAMLAPLPHRLRSIVVATTVLASLTVHTLSPASVFPVDGSWILIFATASASLAGYLHLRFSALLPKLVVISIVPLLLTVAYLHGLLKFEYPPSYIAPLKEIIAVNGFMWILSSSLSGFTQKRRYK